MRFFQSERNVTNQSLVRKNMKRPSPAKIFLTPKKLRIAIFFNEDGGKITILEGCSKCYYQFINVKIILRFRKYCQILTGLTMATQTFRATTYNTLTISCNL